MTQQWRTRRPGADEHAPFYAGYVVEAPGADVLATLEQQGPQLAEAWRRIPEARGGFRYAEGKWSVKDVIQHVIDAERIFSYRLLRFARADATNLPGFDENSYVPEAQADRRTVAELADEFAVVRQATVALIAGLDDAAMARRGAANNQPISARALAWIMAGHAAHHARVLQERYR